MSYAVISIGTSSTACGKASGCSWTGSARRGQDVPPDLIMLGGDGDAKLGSDLKGQQVTVKVAEHVKGKKIVVGKHKRRTATSAATASAPA